MDISVIGDYESPEYRDLLMKVKILQADETIQDLSRHNSGVWSKDIQGRHEDIRTANLVVISRDWDRHLDAKVDIHYAQQEHKECMIEQDGKFIPFTTKSYSFHK